MTDRPATQTSSISHSESTPASTPQPSAAPVYYHLELRPSSNADDSPSTPAITAAAASSPLLPTPLLRLELRDLSLSGTSHFLHSFDASTDLAFAVRTVLSLLYPAPSSASSSSTTPASVSAPPAWPATRSVTLIVRDMPGVAYTCGLDLDNDHKELHLSATYVAAQPASHRRNELLGVLVHEMVHAWQWNACGTAPSGLIEGVADWVRLRAGFAAPHWGRDELPVRWDQGYQQTGYFLQWLEETCGEGTVVKLNARMRAETYDEDRLWRGVCGQGVQDLFERYCDELRKKLPQEWLHGTEGDEQEDHRI